MESAPVSPTSTPGPTAGSNHISGRYRVVLLALGWLFVGLAAIGVVLPVVPTTPFLLVAAACFARSSPRLYRRLLESRMFGPTIRRWRETRTLSRRVKLNALLVLSIAAGGSALFCLQGLWPRIIFLTIVATVATWLLRIPSTASSAAREQVRNSPADSSDDDGPRQ